MAPIPIYLAVEDDLSETVLRRLLRERPTQYAIGAVFKKGGFGYLKRMVRAFNNLAKECPVLLLTDLDLRPCAPELVSEWLKQPRHPDFLLRVAVREVEAWLLASHQELGSYLGLRRPSPIGMPEAIPDPKSELLRICAKSPRRDRREAIVRTATNGKLFQGPAYNSTLGEFVNDFWPVAIAAGKCPSLARALAALEALEAKRGTIET